MAFVFSCSLTPMLSTHTPLPINARACSDCDDHSLVNSVNWWTATRTGGGAPTTDRLLALDLWIIFTSCLVSIKIKLEAILRWDHTRRQTGQGCKILAPYSRPPRSDHAHFRPSFWCQRHICKVLWVCPARLCHADWLKTCSVVVPATVGVIRTKWHTLTHKLKTTPVVTVVAGKNSGCYCGAAQSSRLYGP